MGYYARMRKRRAEKQYEKERERHVPVEVAVPEHLRGRRRAKRVCEAKIAYGSEEAARALVGVVAERAYQCPVCHGWHLTSHEEAA